MQLHPLKPVTIITEQVLRDQIVQNARDAGASGCTYQETQGTGSRGARSNDVFGGNVRIEIVCAENVAEAILTFVSHHFFEHYACIAWVTDVSVVRGVVTSKSRPERLQNVFGDRQVCLLLYRQEMLRYHAGVAFCRVTWKALHVDRFSETVGFWNVIRMSDDFGPAFAECNREAALISARRGTKFGSPGGAALHMKRIGILTAGGDTPALNATIHGRTARL